MSVLDAVISIIALDDCEITEVELDLIMNEACQRKHSRIVYTVPSRQP